MMHCSRAISHINTRSWGETRSVSSSNLQIIVTLQNPPNGVEEVEDEDAIKRFLSHCQSSGSPNLLSCYFAVSPSFSLCLYVFLSGCPCTTFFFSSLETVWYIRNSMDLDDRLTQIYNFILHGHEISDNFLSHSVPQFSHLQNKYASDYFIILLKWLNEIICRE